MPGGIKNHYDCIREFSEVDYTKDLEKIDLPTLVIHGDDDQIVPIDAVGRHCVTAWPAADDFRRRARGIDDLKGVTQAPPSPLGE